MGNSKLLDVEKIVKSYGEKTVLSKISFHLMSGEKIILVGKNGAGKTSLIKIILNLIPYDSGALNFSFPSSIKSKLFYVPEEASVYEYLTVSEHVEFVAKLYSIENWKDNSEKLLKIFLMDNDKNTLAKSLSKGTKKKLNIICALLVNPQFLVLDEPYSGLDIDSITIVNKFLDEYDGTILLSSHILNEIDFQWNRCLILNNHSITEIHVYCNNLKEKVKGLI